VRFVETGPELEQQVDVAVALQIELRHHLVDLGESARNRRARRSE
jgi:hypothetical protein